MRRQNFCAMTTGTTIVVLPLSLCVPLSCPCCLSQAPAFFSHVQIQLLYIRCPTGTLFGLNAISASAGTTATVATMKITFFGLAFGATTASIGLKQMTSCGTPFMHVTMSFITLEGASSAALRGTRWFTSSTWALSQNCSLISFITQTGSNPSAERADQI